MNKIYADHLRRIKTAVLKRYTASQVAQWVTENTTIGLVPFTYRDHEYQERILSDLSRETVVRKCSQVGISEVSSRKALALVNVLQPYTVAYTLPTAIFAGTFAKTRIDPIINGSDAMKEAIHSTNDNSGLKQFRDSFLYIRGAASSNAPISIPCDHLIHDELDFCDQEVIGQYTSRLTHSQWKRVDKFSTPTIPKFGIDLAFTESRRHFLMCKCDHCNHQFIPSYYDHVRIPDYAGDLKSINKSLLPKLRWGEAFLECPKCGKRPSLQWSQREWVCENPNEGHVAAGYQVSPFDAPNIISCADLVKASTAYDRYQDFVNFNLGLPSEDSEATLQREDFARVFGDLMPVGGQYVMGIDVGAQYYVVVASIDPYGGMWVVHTEKVPMRQAKARIKDLRLQYRVITSVIDSAPHGETVSSMQQEDVNLFASVYIRSKDVYTHRVVDREDDPDKGQRFVRQVNVNRNKALDAYMEFIRNNNLRVVTNAEYEEIISHHCSMKRVKMLDTESHDMSYVWQKTDGMDHYHHAFLYCWVAGQIKGVHRTIVQLPTAQMFKFQIKQKK
jgi:hypothetical protein